MLISVYLSGDLESVFRKAHESEGKSAQVFIRDMLRERLNTYDNRDTVMCRRCENVWLPRVENPGYCPACKSHAWMSEPISKTMYPGLSELQIGQTMKLQFNGVPDPKPMRAVNYQKRRYGKRFTAEGKGMYLYVTRVGSVPASIDEVPQ